jgi:protein-S-isoprenylcysteine O-methyltransferase Ste14
MASYFGERTARFLRLAQRIRVPAGFILAPLMIIASRPSRVSMAAGSIVALAGLGIRAWASGYLKKNEELATLGPYSYTRNPLYLGTFLLGLGISVCTGSWWFMCIFGLLYLLVYVPVMIAEGETLRKLFPDQYQDYSDRVPFLVPRLTARSPGMRPAIQAANSQTAERLFDPSLYLRHREYRALIGFVAAVGILILKAWLSP